MVYGKQTIYWRLFYIPQPLYVLIVAYKLKPMQQFNHLFQDTIWFGKIKQPMVYGSKTTYHFLLCSLKVHHMTRNENCWWS